MKVAVIEHDEIFISQLEVLCKDFEWEVDFFITTVEFGEISLEIYDVVIADLDLPNLSGRELIRSISKKTDAQLFLLGETDFTEEDVDNCQIAGLIDKENVNEVVKHLKYIDAKLRINESVKKEFDKYNDILKKKDSFSIEIKDDVILIGISTLLTDRAKIKIIEEIEKMEKIRGVIFFPKKKFVPSAFLCELAYFYKVFTSRKGAVVFWNATDSATITEQLKICRLDTLFPIFVDLDKAIEFLHKKVD